MEPGCGADPAPVSQPLPRNSEQLIRKLRWIGLEEAGMELQVAGRSVAKTTRGRMFGILIQRGKRVVSDVVAASVAR